MCNHQAPLKKSHVIRKLVALCAGYAFCQAAYGVVLTLQTSINISEGLGAASITATYATAAICGLFVSPLMLQHVGPKASILICEAFFLTYAVANYYPDYATLIPTAILLGFAEVTFFPSVMLFSAQFAYEYSQFGEKDEQVYVTQFTGFVFASVLMGAVFGCAVSQVIFFGGSSTDYEPSFTNVSMTTAAPFVRDLSVCGRNDCQDPNITSINYEAYRPASEFLLYVLFGVMASLIVIAFILNAILLGKYVRKSERKNFNGPSVNDSSGEEKSLNEDNVNTTPITSTNESALKKVLGTAKAICLQLSNPRQLLVLPLILYYGLLTGMWMTDFSRAFVSCIVGVEKVSLYNLVSTSIGMIVAVCSGLIASYFGRNVLFSVSFAIDLSYYLLVALWAPSDETSWILFLLFIGAGFSDGIWPTTTNSMVIEYFPDNQEIALSIWSLCTLLGVVWQTAWNTSLCVYQRIYFQIAMLCFAMLCHRIAVHFYGNGPSKPKSKTPESKSLQNTEEKQV